MTTTINWSDPEAAAKLCAGNWRNFDCFAWHDRPDDADRWAIFYTGHRDSDLLDQSNSSAINKQLEKFTEANHPDARAERHSHWAVGWVDGWAIRVYKPADSPANSFRHHKCLGCGVEYDAKVRMSNHPVTLSGERMEKCGACGSKEVYSSPAMQITDAFRSYCALRGRLDDYPILDETDYYNREYDAALDWIRQEGKRHVKDGAHEGWPAQVFDLVWNNPDFEGELHNTDDTGATPSEESIKWALGELGLLDEDD